MAYWSTTQRTAIITFCSIISIIMLWCIFREADPTPMPQDLAQCYKLFDSRDTVSGEVISQSLEISRKFHATQKKLRNSAQTAAIHKFMSLTPKDVLLHLVPEVACLGRVRVGSTGDGGKWMCSPWKVPENCVVYSLGSFDDTTFESDLNELTNKRCSILTVDKDEPNKLTQTTMREQGIQFVRGKISATTNEKLAEYAIEHLMTIHSHEKIDFLKMDIEGSEYEVLPKFLRNHKVCQLLVEIHDLQRVPWLLREIANNGYLLINYEINAEYPANGLSEYAFIHSSCLATYDTYYLSGFIHS